MCVLFIMTALAASDLIMMQAFCLFFLGPLCLMLAPAIPHYKQENYKNDMSFYSMGIILLLASDPQSAT